MRYSTKNPMQRNVDSGNAVQGSAALNNIQMIPLFRSIIEIDFSKVVPETNFTLLTCT